MSQLPDHFDLDDYVTAVLAEDLGHGGDVTSANTIAEGARFVAVMDTRQDIAVAGLAVAEAFFRRLDHRVEIERLVEDGDVVPAGTDLMRIVGDARAMLAAERSALNSLQVLCGIATQARAFAQAIEGTGAKVLDTRKTIPGMRALSKYASRMGGAHNHRMRMDDGLLIKDNHIAVNGGDIALTVARAKAGRHGLEVQVEVDRIDQIEPALEAGADRLLLDNMPPATLREAVALVDGRVPLEASGGIDLDTIRAVAETGVDYISTSKITMGAPAVDIGLDYALC
ncbi:carboxylating nicotinate-nucleotide diphosphorylase [Sphingomicrobium astaxanthinifaciens]|uniref:carboxylating nicotinate-nucleotide diphosphorylase n=1 Tax=Sphingomicrobium astaxanthinifaciens TaxID=1227949 RepID=UPI001FCC9D4F|nr:carboxylating nicotinate-nucleotide diphosphorylase [Sphingomicrobium astaxanthinifaciens]MCJ7421897.1 carboxylating nicotinate-nucleotide diphosphorylase [Sphingomicrobium astaxanthinifaciens]